MKINKLENDSLIEDIAALEKACFTEFPWTESMIEAVVASPFRHVFALSKNEKILGYAIMQIISGEGEIERIGIDPSHRGQSLGKYLLLNILSEPDIETCFLEVSESNQAARRLYDICGFEEIGRRYAYYRDGADAIMMKWKRITDE